MSKVYLDKAGIEKLIVTITRTGKKLDNDIQEAGLSCLNHIELHKDITLFNRLYLALPRGARKTAMTQWALAFGKLKANTAAGTKDLKPFLYDREKDTLLDAAAAKPWYDFAPDKKPDEIADVRAMIFAILKKADKAPGIAEPEVLASLRIFAADLPEKVEADA